MSHLKNILIVDDDEHSLGLYQKLLASESGAEISIAKLPTHALKMAKENFFDICLLDITMNFHGSPFGGIDLYNILSPRYGAHSLLAYSQYITDDLLQRYQCSFNFIEKNDNVIAFIGEAANRLKALRANQRCFVAMPFDHLYDDIYGAIADSVQRAGYVPVRLDRLPFTASIVEKMLQEIRDAKAVVFVATDKNPNAFYECGYAVALEKEVVTITDFHRNLPFDIRDRNSIAYGKNIGTLKTRLYDRLIKLSQVG